MSDSRIPLVICASSHKVCSIVAWRLISGSGSSNSGNTFHLQASACASLISSMLHRKLRPTLSCRTWDGVGGVAKDRSCSFGKGVHACSSIGVAVGVLSGLAACGKSVPSAVGKRNSGSPVAFNSCRARSPSSLSNGGGGALRSLMRPLSIPSLLVSRALSKTTRLEDAVSVSLNDPRFASRLAESAGVVGNVNCSALRFGGFNLLAALS
mmetsp:Transcript_68812/g.151626  ORF Transcript_68812/g.151626 Transcript_68812/m.151626 type:complete len:210 (-) Transcript_68812:221-850(-)